MDNTNNKNLVLENSLLKTPIYYYLYQKSSKILNVLYIVSSFIPPQEPLSKEIKVCGLNIIKDITQSFKNDNETKLDKDLKEALAGHLHALISFLDLAQKNGYISDMNHRVIKDELLSLIQLLSKTSEKGLNSSDFYVKGIEIKDKVVSDTPKRTFIQTSGQKTNLSEKHSERRKLILGVIKSKGQVTIKDISVSMSDCSEKTLQRELMSLINEGIIKKEGERRWSKYFLTQS